MNFFHVNKLVIIGIGFSLHKICGKIQMDNFVCISCRRIKLAKAHQRFTHKTCFLFEFTLSAHFGSFTGVKLSGRNGTAVATNTFFSAEADAEGVASAFGAGGGWYRLLCRISDDADSTLVEYLTTEFEMPYSFVLSIR